MFATVNGVSVFYQRHEGEGVPVLLLHGWGASSGAMSGVYRELVGQNRTVAAVDFPGFGQSDLPPATWGTADYADCIEALLPELFSQKPVIVGHSFGGRIAILLGARGRAAQLVLVDAAGIKPRPSLKKRLAVLAYKRRKKRGTLRGNEGSEDYRALPDEMRSVFVRVVNTHLEEYLPRIAVPTLLVWGEKDDTTPLYMAKKLNQRIAGSGLVVLRDCGHFSYAENHGRFCLILQSFITNGEQKK